MNPVPRFLSDEETRRITNTVINLARGEGNTVAYVASWWNSELRWARNRVNLAGDRRDVTVTVMRDMDAGLSVASTNQLDDQSLEATVRAAERGAEFALKRSIASYPIPIPKLPVPQTSIWSDHTYNVTAAQRGALAQTLTSAAEAHAMLSAGYVEMRAGQVAVQRTDVEMPDVVLYSKYSQAQCSMTVRHPKGIGSGWAGGSSYDWAAIDSSALATRALEKCLASLNPVAIEPGRYMVVLEPQAVSQLTDFLIGALNDRPDPERQEDEPFTLMLDPTTHIRRTKLGQRVTDERITISHDPADPLLGIVPDPGLSPITWVDRGTLTTLSYNRDYALTSLNENLGAIPRLAYRMSGGTTSLDDMIQTTKRGLLVTRFSDIMPLDHKSLLGTGVTRDGLWLIENGKIAKSVKNLRFTESPLFVLNQIEQLGVPVSVFTPVDNPYDPGVRPVIVPPLKVRDFSFTALADAI